MNRSESNGDERRGEGSGRWWHDKESHGIVVQYIRVQYSVTE